MRSIILKTAVLFALSISFSAAQAEDAAEVIGSNEMMASQFARWVSQIESPADVTEALPISAKDAAVVEAEMKKSKDSFGRLEVNMIMPTKFEVKTGGEVFYVSYRQFDKGVLYINDKAVKLEKHKMFYNYRSEIDTILAADQPKSVYQRFNLISEAYAQKKNNVRNLMAAVGVSNGVVYRGFGQKYVEEQNKSQLKDLPVILIQAFRNESARAKATDKKLSRPAFFSAFTFTCQGTQMTEVKSQMLVAKGKVDSTVLEKLVVDGRGYRFTNRECDIKVDKNGKWLAGQKRAPTCMSNDPLFGSHPFMHFPKAAKQCCSLKGCYEAVKAATAGIVSTHLKGKRPAAK